MARNSQTIEQELLLLLRNYVIMSPIQNFKVRVLSDDNAGLIAAAITLNSGIPISVATEICNAQNELEGVTVCRNTLMNSLRKYTDVDLVSTLRRKTGSKDEESVWAKARLIFALQLMKQIKAGELIDMGETYTYKFGEPQPIKNSGLVRIISDRFLVEMVIPACSGHRNG